MYETFVGTFRHERRELLTGKQTLTAESRDSVLEAPLLTLYCDNIQSDHPERDEVLVRALT